MRNTYIGTPMERREDLRFLRGRGEFVDDLAVDGLLHAVILRSLVAHGRILSLDGYRSRSVAATVQAETTADVDAVLTR